MNKSILPMVEEGRMQMWSQDIEVNINVVM